MSKILALDRVKLNSFYNDKYENLYLEFISENTSYIQIRFVEPIYFTYKYSSECGARISLIQKNEAMHKVLLTNYVQVPDNHPFNFYQITNDVGDSYIEVVAQKVSVQKIK